ncbi:efflux RND transporter periplasmic adaptor subunit [Gluconacetobacter azotocaptans]|uniref:Efflux RND transporter periplasmic adaptor subunit n=1 Tax=Gluconacetobacter azotocaptans TaxID=142834 RepID=A0A7W4JPY8_9PROT|nr:efflux RND transporter periplasmic adaptor subunit [Gluconacetobacter azotocaptans]MBB2188762.1 efflux RND transporter periplasmic adaptor subunit [Gluconacetobacter azotocaptans]GBQ35771.1 membrane-fusion protein [Gluconacetobacter azotocaptans DSM 13594]
MSEPVSAPVKRPVTERRTGALIGLGLVAALGYGVYAHVARGVAVRALAMQRQTLVPAVRTMQARVETDPALLDLPGETAPLETAAIGARASGYIERRFVDIGTPVKAGQVLAVIRAPELDQQVAHAQAVLGQARADLDLARVTARRSGGLVGGGAVSKQNFDTDRIMQQARVAEQDAAHAAWAEIAQRQAYTSVTAPFDGVVTARTIEAGDLVSADSMGAQPLFVVARTDRLRVRVHVPQEEARDVAVGTSAVVRVPERPGQTFAGTVARTGHALERDSRMLPVEIELDNRDGRLAAGLYTTIHFALPRDTRTILIPAEALLYEADGLSVATVDGDNRIRMHKVTVGRDYGDRIEIQDGLPDGSQLVIHPPSALYDGSLVAPRPDAKGA